MVCPGPGMLPPSSAWQRQIFVKFLGGEKQLCEVKAIYQNRHNKAVENMPVFWAQGKLFREVQVHVYGNELELHKELTVQYLEW